MKEKQHIDGIWKTSEYQYKNRKIVIKSRKGKGIKCHVSHLGEDCVDFTLRYSFMTPSVLLEKAKNKIDLYYGGKPHIK